MIAFSEPDIARIHGRVCVDAMALDLHEFDNLTYPIGQILLSGAI